LVPEDPEQALQKYSVGVRDMVESYWEQRRWQRGIGVLIIGPPDSGKTTLGLTIGQGAYLIEEYANAFWTEQDFIADLRAFWTWQDMISRMPKDDSLWTSYTDWERQLWDYKDTQVLLFDACCRGYTPMHWYESEGLLRFRSDRNLPTTMTVDRGLLEGASASMRSIMMKHNIVIDL
jgi:hypothetical protein